MRACKFFSLSFSFLQVVAQPFIMQGVAGLGLLLLCCTASHASPPLRPPSASPPPSYPALPACQDLPNAFEGAPAWLGGVSCSHALPFLASRAQPTATLCAQLSVVFENILAPWTSPLPTEPVAAFCNCTCSLAGYGAPASVAPAATGIRRMRGCCTGHHLRIAIEPFSKPPLYEYEGGRFTGYTVSLLELLRSEMGFTYELVPASLFDAYQALVLPTNVSGAAAIDPTLVGGSIDLMISNNAALLEGCTAQYSSTCFADSLTNGTLPSSLRQSGYGTLFFTQPFYTSSYSGLVRVSPQNYQGWRIFLPFTEEVWLATGVVLIVVAALIHALEHLDPSKLAKGCPKKTLTKKGVAREARSFAEALYVTTATCLGGEDYEWSSWPARLLRLSLLLCVLVLLATYTANLASFLTKPQVVRGGPEDFSQLSSQTACLTLEPTRAFEFTSNTVALPGSANFGATSENGYRGDSSFVSRGTQYCLDALQARTADIYLEDRNILHSLHLANCATTGEVDFISINPLRHFFVSRGDTAFGQRLGTNMTKAIVMLEADPQYQELKLAHFDEGQTCGARALSDDDLTPVTFQQMEGLFIIVGGLALCAIALALAEAGAALCRRRKTTQTATVSGDTAGTKTVRTSCADGGSPGGIGATPRAGETSAGPVAARRRSTRCSSESDGQAASGELLREVLARLEQIQEQIDTGMPLHALEDSVREVPARLAQI